MKKPTFLSIARISPDVIDGPGWTDIDVNGCYNSDDKYVPPQDSSNPSPEPRGDIEPSM